MRILFVENHAVFAQQVCREFLSVHEVTVVASLSAARLELAKNTYDLLLVDYDLDDGKGDELLREVRLTNPELRSVAVSSHEKGNAALVEAGASAICSKMEFDRIQKVISGL